MTLVDRHLPQPDVREHHTILVDRPPAAVMAEVRAVRMRDMPLTAVLMGIRGLTELVRGRGRLQTSVPLFDQFVEWGFCVLEDTSTELVAAAAGRFWRIDSGIEPVPAERFGDYARPGTARAVVAMGAEPAGEGSLLWTETRVKAADEAARRSFTRYWRIVRPGSVLIRHELLRAVRRRAERNG
jgi:hypothetical protein